MLAANAWRARIREAFGVLFLRAWPRPRFKARGRRQRQRIHLQNVGERRASPRLLSHPARSTAPLLFRPSLFRAWRREGGREG